MIATAQEAFSYGSLQWAAVIGGSLAAAVLDWRSRRIPNWLTGPLFLAGLIWSAHRGGVSGAGDGLLGAVMLATPYIVLFLIAGGGAADAKLMGALGAWLGTHYGCIVLLAVCITGAAMGLLYALTKRRVQDVVHNLVLIWVALMALLVGRRKWAEVAVLLPDPKDMLAIPYGLAVFVGVCIAGAWLYLYGSGA